MTKEIQLTQGGTVLVDEADYEWLKQWRWQFQHGYAIRVTKFLGVSKTLFMHREIMNPQKGFEVDHINHNKLDNRRENLRICTRSQNQSNNGLSRINTSGFKGVTFHKKTQKWQSQIGIDGKIVYIGLFDTPEKAAHAYDEVAREKHGVFANLNFDQEGQRL
jgi:HNH endonuclease/AP2 domain-containing protein